MPKFLRNSMSLQVVIITLMVVEVMDMVMEELIIHNMVINTLIFLKTIKLYIMI